ncbi:MerR family DNA-binding protein [Rubrivirga sp. S365]|uniref:MerR family transcriptional regulator n=1 Tax=Rubrivirga sp. S365 TaxID=3076080 RepID=UPI0028C8185D|nr:MerR family DNA-binding protein [Rubrivirga sp. S365]MDT7858096.1 MerR family DNA-binding protein [Rubrivirga sp. S365]
MALTRSALARAVGVAPSAVRYYERVGVLPEPARTAKGYRVYGPEDVDRLRFVRRAQDLGFTLAETTGLLDLAVSAGDPCDGVRARAEAHRDDVAAKVRDLERIRETLDTLIAACHDHAPTAPCPILDALRHDDDSTDDHPTDQRSA